MIQNGAPPMGAFTMMGAGGSPIMAAIPTNAGSSGNNISQANKKSKSMINQIKQ
jgi:hypothetical protein